MCPKTREKEEEPPAWCRVSKAAPVPTGHGSHLVFDGAAKWGFEGVEAKFSDCCRIRMRDRRQPGLSPAPRGVWPVLAPLVFSAPTRSSQLHQGPVGGGPGSLWSALGSLWLL
ncbi:hypothetical protein NC651_035371 [Populus alba x Populus x berolinensis]|nr:hypothetical protein NC651_035371 [Populus alba x Populus x berolinensis]